MYDAGWGELEGGCGGGYPGGGIARAHLEVDEVPQIEQMSNLPGRVAPSETCVVVHPSVGLLQGVSHAGTLGWGERGARP